jgi:hypothetical protein
MYVVDFCGGTGFEVQAAHQHRYASSLFISVL